MLETITWKFGHELSLHFCFYLPAERTLALDNFGNFVPFNYPVLSSDFGSGCCDSWMSCLMCIAGDEHGYPMIMWQKSGMCPSYDTTAGSTHPPTRTIPLSSMNVLNDLELPLDIPADRPACAFFIQYSSACTISSAFNAPTLTWFFSLSWLDLERMFWRKRMT